MIKENNSKLNHMTSAGISLAIVLVTLKIQTFF